MAKRRVRWLLTGSRRGRDRGGGRSRGDRYGGGNRGQQQGNHRRHHRYRREHRSRRTSTDYDSFTVQPPDLPGLYGFPTGAKLKPRARYGMQPHEEPQDLDVPPETQREVLERRPHDLGGRQVLVRPGAEDQGRPGHLDAAHVSQEHDHERPVHGRLPPDESGLDWRTSCPRTPATSWTRTPFPANSILANTRYGSHDRHRPTS